MSYPDFIDDREGLDRWRASSREGDGHEVVANKNTVFRFVQTIDRLEREAQVSDLLNAKEQPISSAPKDGTMIWLLVDYSEGGGPLADAQRAWTIGFNNLGNTGEDAWKFAGWCWSHDHFTEGSGTPVAWRLIGFELEADDEEHSGCETCGEEHPAGVLDSGLCPACIDLDDEPAEAAA